MSWLDKKAQHTRWSEDSHVDDAEAPDYVFWRDFYKASVANRWPITVLCAAQIDYQVWAPAQEELSISAASQKECLYTLYRKWPIRQ